MEAFGELKQQSDKYDMAAVGLMVLMFSLHWNRSRSENTEASQYNLINRK